MTMRKRHHPSRVAARRELLHNGFALAHTPPDYPELWRRPKSQEFYGLQRDVRARSIVWHIVPYPGQVKGSA